MSGKIYDFDTTISRIGHNSAKWGEEYIGSGSDMLLPFWVADTDFPAPDEVNEALRACVDHGIYGYVRPSASCLQAAASWQLRRHGFQAQPEWITVTPGIDCAMATAVQAFTEPGDKVLINTPIYDPFFEVIEKNDRETVDSPMELRDGRYEFNWADFEEKVRDCRIWMFCNPQNPEGRCFTEEELRKAGEICGKYGVLMLSDEIHGDIVYDGRKHIPLASLSKEFCGRTITCTSPSKTFSVAGTAASVIFIENETLRERFRTALAKNSPGVGCLSLVAMEAAYTYGDSYADQLVAYLQGNRDYLLDYLKTYLPQIHPIFPEAMFLVWLDCSGLGFTAEELPGFYQKAGVRLSMGDAYRERSGQFVRLNFGCARATLTAGLERIRKAAERLTRDN